MNAWLKDWAKRQDELLQQIEKEPRGNSLAAEAVVFARMLRGLEFAERDWLCQVVNFEAPNCGEPFLDWMALRYGDLWSVFKELVLLNLADVYESATEIENVEGALTRLEDLKPWVLNARGAVVPCE